MAKTKKKTLKVKKGGIKTETWSTASLRKVAVCFLLTVGMLFPVSVFAQDIIEFSKLNLAGDTLYLPDSGSFAVGIGTNLATIKDIVEVRGMYVSPVNSDEPNKIGLGIGLNLPKLINKIGGTWLVNSFNASIGITGLTNLNGPATLEPAIYLTVIQVGL